jgi:hypothetical protein
MSVEARQELIEFENCVESVDDIAVHTIDILRNLVERGEVIPEVQESLREFSTIVDRKLKSITNFTLEKVCKAFRLYIKDKRDRHELSEDGYKWLEEYLHLTKTCMSSKRRAGNYVWVGLCTSPSTRGIL